MAMLDSGWNLDPNRARAPFNTTAIAFHTAAARSKDAPFAFSAAPKTAQSEWYLAAVRRLLDIDI
jgi:hypothetical protein